MNYPDDPRVAEARAKGMDWFVDALRIEGLKRSGREMVGPCPRPGCGGDDRFSVDLRKGVFHCRRCESDGGKGDGIALVMMVLGLTFPEALTWACGDRQEISAEEQARRARDSAAAAARKEAEARRYRAEALRQARAIWQAGVPGEGSPVRYYLAQRGIGPDALPKVPKCLRYHSALPYMVKDGDAWIEVHRGPAMLAAIQDAGGRFSAVHRTWIDPGQPKGKARISHAGADLKVKKTWGSKKGGAIRLLTPPGADTLIMGEGIETTLSPVAVGAFPAAAFWAGIDLDNLSGLRQSGPGLKYAGLPDLGDGEAFLPPPWVKRLIFIQDGDSEPRHTTARLEAGLRRAMVLRPGLVGQLVRCPPGADLNDVLLGFQETVDG
jgi:hypothetical protein